MKRERLENDRKYRKKGLEDECRLSSPSRHDPSRHETRITDERLTGYYSPGLTGFCSPGLASLWMTRFAGFREGCSISHLFTIR